MIVRVSLENFRPPRFGTICILGEHSLVRQCELASGLSRHDINTYPRGLTRIFWNAEREDQTARPVDVEILAAVLDVLSVAPFDNDELTSDTRIDLDPHHLSGRRRE